MTNEKGQNMIKTIYHTVRMKFPARTLREAELSGQVHELRSSLDSAMDASSDELNVAMAQGFQVLTSHVIETDTHTFIVFVLYLSPDAVKVPF